MCFSRAQVKGRMDDPDVLQEQAAHGSCEGRGDPRGILEQKPNAKTDGQNKKMTPQSLPCGNGSPITEEPRRQPVVGKGAPEPSFLMEEQTQPMNEDWQRGLSGGPCQEDDIWERNASPFPKERLRADSQPSISSCCRQETREATFPTVNRTTAGICGNPGVSKPPGARTAKNYAGRKQPIGKEAQFGNNGVRKMDKEVYLPFSKCKERETDGSRLSVEDPTSHDLSRCNPGRESQGDLRFPAGENGDPHNYLEDFLSEGALVSINSAQTDVDLETGTIQTHMEVSAQDGGVVVKHKVEWFTEFESSCKLK